MSSDLVRRLRVDMHAYGICQKAADRIEALEGEVERMTRDYIRSERSYAEKVAAEARAERLEAQYAAYRETTHEALQTVNARAERLRVALDKVKHLSRNQVTERMDAIFQTAVEAIEDEQ